MIDVAFTRSQLRASDVAVVVDVLRATSTATQALAAGYRRVLCTETIGSARRLRAPWRVLAGERCSLKPAGFDQGNSPAEALVRRADELVLATTNGAPTIVAASRQCPRVLLACLLNLDAVVAALRSAWVGPETHVQIVCSGADGAVALEDVYVAGRLSAALPGARTDSALGAEAVARAYATPLEALSTSAAAARLTAAGLAEDVAFCARESELEVLPVVVAGGSGLAAVAVAGAEAGAGVGGRTGGIVRTPALDGAGTVGV